MGDRMGNNALRQALVDAKRTEADLASACGVDLQTVSRWLTKEDRVPHARHRYEVCRLLEVDESMIWPESVRGAIKTGPDREIVTVYPTRSAMPRTVWQRLIGTAQHELALCGYTSYFLWSEVPGLSLLLRRKVEAGCRVRFVLGDPDAEVTHTRDHVETSPVTVSARIQQALHHLEPLRDVVEVRQTDEAGLNRSVWRGDDQAVASWNVAGKLGQDSPVFHLRRHQDGGIFDQLAVDHVEGLWERARPL